MKKIAIEKLIPYDNNPRRHTKKQIQSLKRSIKEYGFTAPILIDEDYNVLAGHGRLQAVTELGFVDVPCVFIEGLTEAQKKAYVIDDNRLGDMSSWDKDLLKIELAEIKGLNFELDMSGFEKIEFEPKFHRDNTIDGYKLRLYDVSQADGKWQMPIIKAEDYTPEKLLSFNHAMTHKDKDYGIHFYIDDYQFERLWNTPDKYTEILRPYDCIFTPDFSLYMDMPMAMKIWNIYRSRLIGQYYQNQGLTVIPTISWAEPETYEFCFDGVEKGGIISVSNVGTARNKTATEIWQHGMAECLKRIEPSKVLLYGNETDFDFGTEVIHYPVTTMGGR